MTVLATVRLYKNCAIAPEKNQIVDEIVAYLASLTSVADTYNYVRHNKTLSIVLPKSMNVLTYDTAGMYNYCAIQNSNEDYPVYYFVVDRRFTSESAVTFDLEMDVVNTFRLGRDYSFGQNTRTLREHRNRFIGTNDAYTFLIDKFSEGLNPPQNKVSEKTANIAKSNFFIRYSTVNGKFVKKLFAKEPIYMYTRKMRGRITTELSKWYILYPSPAYNESILSNEHITLYANYNSAEFYAFFRDTDISTHIMRGIVTKYGITITKEEQVISSSAASNQFNIITFSQEKVAKELPNTFTLTYLYNLSPADFRLLNIPAGNIVAATSQSTEFHEIFVPSVHSVDQYDENTYKVIAIPYLPTPDFLHSGIAGSSFLPNDRYEVFLNERLADIVTFGEISKSYLNLPFDATYTKAQIRAYTGHDPKCFHSDFCTAKLGYDSFAMQFKPESWAHNNISLKVVNSQAMLSRFAVIVTNDVETEVNEDIPHVMYVARNSEVPLYTSAYLEYINLGYNYDVKAKERQIKAAELKTAASALSAAGSIAATVAGIATQNYAVAALSVAGAIAGVVQTIQSVQNQVEANDDSINRKVDELQRQSDTIRNADDYDIMTAYGGDELKFYVFQAPERVLNALDRLFKLFGYASDSYGVPSVNTRKFWNFLQADIDLSQTSYMLRGLPKTIRETLIQKYHDGVTFLHGLNPDFAQTQNNYEVIFDEV